MKRINKNKYTLTILAGLLLAIAASPAQALPPDPDNAALLYYQGFLSMPQFSEEARDRIEEVARGKILPDDKVREDIAQSAGAIHFTEAGTKVLACNWGVEFSRGFDTLMPQLAQTRLMTFVMLADARLHAADGDYRAALERCIMTETFAYHAGDDTFISYLVSLSARKLAYQCIQDITGQAAGNVKLLQWLKNELAKSPINTISAVRPLKFEIEITTDLMQMKNIEKLARIMSESNKDKATEIVNKANEEILRKARRIYTERMNSAIKAWDTSVPYEQAHSQLKKLEKDINTNDPAAVAARAFIPTIARILTLKVGAESHANAIKAGIDILLSRARTGQIPDKLPAGLPKDAFSGKDFEYEKTKEGFILRCRGRDLDKDEINKYEFKLSK